MNIIGWRKVRGRFGFREMFWKLVFKRSFAHFLMDKVSCLKSRTFTVVTFRKFGGGERKISRKYGVGHDSVLRWPLLVFFLAPTSGKAGFINVVM